MARYELTPEQLARDRRMMDHIWTVLDNAPEKILEHVSPPMESAEGSAPQKANEAVPEQVEDENRTS